MGKRRQPSDEDIELFRSMVGDVRPVKGDAQPPRAPAPAPVPRQMLRDERAAAGEAMTRSDDDSLIESGEELLYLRPGLARNILRNLRRGHYVVEDELDLHGMTSAEARTVLGEFFKEARLHEKRCLRIVHGKGLRSSNQGPVLKPLVNQWLRLRNDVLAFCSARAVDGGTGAVYVLLKKR